MTTTSMKTPTKTAASKIFKILHPNGTSAKVRAPKERIALDLLKTSSQDLDWEFGQIFLLSEEETPDTPEILWVGQPIVRINSVISLN